jgi:TolB protein
MLKCLRLLILMALAVIGGLFVPPAHATFHGNVGSIIWGLGQIFAINPDGTGFRALTSPGPCCYPSYSPDGRTIAFMNGLGLYRMNATGGPITKILAAEGLHHFWLPDGRILLIRTVDPQVILPPEEYYAIDQNGGSRQTLFTIRGLCCGQESPHGVAWFPDGRTLAFPGDGDVHNTSAIYIMNADGTGQRRVGPSLPFATDWIDLSPDGTKLVLKDFTPQGKNIYTMNIDGTDLRRVGEGLDPVWSPDGKQIAFVDYDPRQIPNPTFLYVMNADGSNRRLVYGSLSRNNVSAPSWGSARSAGPRTRHRLSSGAAKTEAQVALVRRFRRAYVNGTRKRVSCKRLSSKRYRCAFSFRYRKYRPAGFATVQERAAGVFGTRIKRR